MPHKDAQIRAIIKNKQRNKQTKKPTLQHIVFILLVNNMINLYETSLYEKHYFKGDNSL